MTSHGELTWTSGLIPDIQASAAAQIVARVSDLAVIVDPSGTIIAAHCNPKFNGKSGIFEWAGAQIQQTLTIESVPKLESRLAQFLKSGEDVLPVEVNHKAQKDFAEFPIRYSLHKLGAADDVLLLGTDLRRTAEMQQKLVAAQLALEADSQSQREHSIRLRVVMESSDVPTFFISVSTGRIESCNSAAERLFGKTQNQLNNTRFADEFEAGGRKDVVDQMVAAATEEADAPVMAKSINGKQKLTLFPSLFRGTAGQMLLCKVNLAKSQAASSDNIQEQLTELFQNGVDAFVFVTASGQIVNANDAFLKIANVTHLQSIKNKSMTDFLALGNVDLNVMIENAKRSGGMRVYATKIVSEHGAEYPVEISTTPLKVGADPVFALVIRDSHRVEHASPTRSLITDVDKQSMFELIGGQSLKDIVAMTTDVVEKTCIETAVEMTSNNRVAAAEMLGMSRQSLYVKLRKYGLVEKH